jgi:Ankyrin repeats (3 copies)
LLSRGARPTAYALAVAAFTGNIDWVDLLLDAGGDVLGTSYAYSPLYHVLKVEDFEMARLFLKRGTRVCNLSLSEAAKSGAEDMVRFLVEDGLLPVDGSFELDSDDEDEDD